MTLAFGRGLTKEYSLYAHMKAESYELPIKTLTFNMAFFYSKYHK